MVKFGILIYNSCYELSQEMCLLSSERMASIEE